MRIAAAGCASAAAAQQLLCGGAAEARPAPRPRVIPRGEGLGPHRDPQEISLVSYNMLAARFATPQRLPHVAPAFLDYERRWALLQREIAEFACDVVCLQEVTIERCAPGRPPAVAAEYAAPAHHPRLPALATPQRPAGGRSCAASWAAWGSTVWCRANPMKLY
jgi:hypothetical protein